MQNTTIWTIIAIYWGIVIIVTYLIRSFKKGKTKSSFESWLPFEEENKKTSFKKQISTHVSIVFLLPPALVLLAILAPFYAPGLILKKHREQRTKKQKEIENNNQGIKTIIDDNLSDDIYKKVSVKLMDALVSGDFFDVGNLLDENVCAVVYSEKTLYGKFDTIEYCREWRAKIIESTKEPVFRVRLTRYNIRPCLQTNNMLVMFRIVGDKICHLLFAPHNDNLLNYPFDYERIKPALQSIDAFIDKDEMINIDNRIPCLSCGMESKDLNWYGLKIARRLNRELWLVSICPKCGCVVEYDYYKLYQRGCVVDYDTYELCGKTDIIPINSYTDSENVYSEKAIRIYSKGMIGDLTKIAFNKKDLLEKYNYTEESLKRIMDKRLAFLFSELSDVDFDDSYSITFKLAECSGTGDSSHLLITDKKGKSSYDIIEHMTIMPTKMGIWQLYLLKNISTVLPCYWHAGYESRHYIYKETDVDDIYPLKYHDLKDLINKNELLPSVELLDKEVSGCTAIVQCCYWNEWKGLVREKATVIVSDERCVSYKTEENTLFYYHCDYVY